jgi:hypothetical protein
MIVVVLLAAPVVWAGGQSEPAAETAQSSSSGSDDSQFELAAGVSTDGGAEYNNPELPEQYQGQSAPAGAGRSFETNFSRATISFSDIISGGPPKDGIPSIDDPSFVSISEADTWLEDKEAVIVFSATEGPSGPTHIYPIRILMYHEIVNDVVGDTPVTVTYCPLCNTGVAFHRVFDGTVMDFGTTGRLRYSNLIMYDRQTETWWQQATGRAIAGEYAGGQLKLLPTLFLSWEDAKERFADAQVLSRDTGFGRPYGSNPYTGYDTANRPFLYRGPELDSSRDPLSRVLTVYVNDGEAGFSYEDLQEQRVMEQTVGGRKVVAFWESGTASALDAGNVAGGRDVGTANAFFAEHDGRTMEFTVRNGAIVDTNTGSEWDVSGRAVSGELEGASLSPVNSIQHFWFSWAAFRDANTQ